MTDDERPDRDDEPPGGSGTVGDTGPLERQAGSLARDAEQDPALGRDRAGGTGAHDEPERTERPDR
jgi:hypothetical protein